MVAFSPDAIRNFIVKKTIKKPFFIDPITHAFQHNQSFICDEWNTKIKKSIAKLINSYWENLKNKICLENGTDLTPLKRLEVSDIDSTFIDEFSHNVLDFQKNISAWKKVDDYKKYIDFANAADPKLGMEINIEPVLLVAPYFYIDTSMEWIDINIRLINKSKELEPDKQVFAQIVIDKKIIEMAAMGNSDCLNSIIQKYTWSNADGFLVWVDDYSEHEEIAKSLSTYADFLRQLRPQWSTKKVYSLYWSYFSIILTKKWILDWVCNGLEYGESRAVIPVGGGIPTAKYYFYPLHKRINEAEMFRFLSIKWVSSFCDEVCDCCVCTELMNAYTIEKFSENYWNTEKSVVRSRNGWFITRHYPSTQTKENSLKHYLHMKYKEFGYVDTSNMSAIKEELVNNFDTYKSYFNSNDIGHLEQWHEAIKVLEL